VKTASPASPADDRCGNATSPVHGRSPNPRGGRERFRIAIIDPDQRAPKLVQRLFASAQSWVCELVEITEAGVSRELCQFDAAVLVDPPSEEREYGDRLSPRLATIFERLEQAQLGVLVVSQRQEVFERAVPFVVCVREDESTERCSGILHGFCASRSTIRGLEGQRRTMQRVNESVNTYFEAMDYELRLASRLQKDFMPAGQSRIGPYLFSTLYRPCSWVSGDIFDFLRLDEGHVGLYLADAVGHGVAAGLLTMYIKHAIRPKIIREDGYRIASPSEVLSHLNEQLMAQELPDAQFITGWYGLLGTRELRLDYAVAGHPPPLHIRADGGFVELHGDGPVLGLAKDLPYETRSISLAPGDRVMVYSDGLEGVLIRERTSLPELPRFQPGITDLLRRPTPELLARLQEALDNAPGSLSHGDDVSIVVVDVAAAS